MDTSSFMPHGHCYQWRADVVLMHSISDAIIAASYYAIPFLLAYIVLKARNHVRFNWLLSLFAIFIVACGTTHVMEIVNIWKAEYVLAGLIKSFTALVSLVTAISMVPALPKIIRILQTGQTGQTDQTGQSNQS